MITQLKHDWWLTHHLHLLPNCFQSNFKSSGVFYLRFEAHCICAFDLFELLKVKLLLQEILLKNVRFWPLSEITAVQCLLLCTVKRVKTEKQFWEQCWVGKHGKTAYSKFQCYIYVWSRFKRNWRWNGCLYCTWL